MFTFGAWLEENGPLSTNLKMIFILCWVIEKEVQVTTVNGAVPNELLIGKATNTIWRKNKGLFLPPNSLVVFFAE